MTKKEQEPARSFANDTLEELQKLMKTKYTFNKEFVGSCKSGTVIRDSNGRFDLDYQIILTKNSKIYKAKKKFNPTKTKRDFYGKLESILNGKGLEDSTTAITFNNPDSKFSIDFVIIDGTDENKWKIIKRNNKNSQNEYTWNLMPDAKNHMSYYAALPGEERHKLAQEIMNLKARDKAMPEDKRDGSYIVTIQAIKEYRDRYEHKN